MAVAAVVGLAVEKVAVRPLEPAGPLTMAIASLAMAIVLENVTRFFFGNGRRGATMRRSSVTLSGPGFASGRRNCAISRCRWP